MVDKNKKETGLDDLLKLEPKLEMNEDITPTNSSDKDQVEVHTMPDKFKQGLKKPEKKSRGWLWILVAIAFLGAIGGGAYWFASTYGPSKSNDLPVVEEPEIPQAPVEPREPILEPEELLSVRQNLTSRLEDEQGDLLVEMRVVIPEGAMNEDYVVEINPQDVGQQSPQDKYYILGGTHEVVSQQDVSLDKNSQITFEYSEEMVKESFEQDISIAYFVDNDWELLSGNANPQANQITTARKDDLLGRYALVVLQETYQEAMASEDDEEDDKNIEDVGADSKIDIDIKLPDTADQDEDGLTDIEETMFDTSLNNKDTDGDSYDDRTEILNLYSPKQGPGEFLLAETDLVKKYETDLGYSLLVPNNFEINEIDTAPPINNVIFSSPEGEFFQMSVQANLENMAVKEWVLLQFADLKFSDVETIEINGLDAIVNPSSTAVYFAVEDKVVILTYGIDDLEEIAYETTFEMFVNSFKKIDEQN